MSWLAPPDSAPEAVNCCVAPKGMVTLAGETEIDVTDVEVRDVVPLTPPNEAVITVEPVVEVFAVARPPLLIAAIPVSEEPHDANDVRSCVAPFCSEPRAKYWTTVPLAINASAGDRVIDRGVEDVNSVEPIIF